MTDRILLLEALNALQALYEENAEYIRINNLGDPSHNQTMKNAKRVLEAQLATADCPACGSLFRFPNYATAKSPERLCDDCDKNENNQ